MAPEPAEPRTDDAAERLTETGSPLAVLFPAEWRGLSEATATFAADTERDGADGVMIELNRKVIHARSVMLVLAAEDPDRVWVHREMCDAIRDHLPELHPAAIMIGIMNSEESAHAPHGSDFVTEDLITLRLTDEGRRRLEELRAAGALPSAEAIAAHLHESETEWGRALERAGLAGA